MFDNRALALGSNLTSGVCYALQVLNDTPLSSERRPHQAGFHGLLLGIKTARMRTLLLI